MYLRYNKSGRVYVAALTVFSMEVFVTSVGGEFW